MQFYVVIKSVWFIKNFFGTLNRHLWWGWLSRRHHHTHINFCTPTTRKCTKTAHKDTLGGIMMLINFKPKILCLGRNESWRAIKTFVVQLEIGWKDMTLGGPEWFEYAKDVEIQQQGFIGSEWAPLVRPYIYIFIYCMEQRYLLFWSWSTTAVMFLVQLLLYKVPCKAHQNTIPLSSNSTTEANVSSRFLNGSS